MHCAIDTDALCMWQWTCSDDGVSSVTVTGGGAGHGREEQALLRGLQVSRHLPQPGTHGRAFDCTRKNSNPLHIVLKERVVILSLPFLTVHRLYRVWDAWLDHKLAEHHQLAMRHAAKPHNPMLSDCTAAGQGQASHKALCELSRTVEALITFSRLWQWSHPQRCLQGRNFLYRSSGLL